MEIRQLMEQDAEQYLTIRLEALKKNPEAFATSYEEEQNQSVNKYLDRFASPGSSYTFGAFDGQDLVGVVTLIQGQKRKLLHRATIVAMYVKEEKRGTGIGKVLVERAIQKARDLAGVEQVYLSVVTDNHSAKRLYTSLGFTIFGTEKNALKYCDIYYDEDHMVLFL